MIKYFFSITCIGPIKTPEKPSLTSINVPVTSEGSNVTLNCRTRNARSDMRDEWLFHSKTCSSNITSYSTVDYQLYTHKWNGSGHLNFSLHLVKVTKANEGCYKCCIVIWKHMDGIIEPGTKQRMCATILLSFKKQGKI